MTAKERLYAKIQFDPNGGCWLFATSLNPLGYGVFWFEGRLTGAHRASWIIHNGEISDRLCVLHRCDVGCCVNPDHLFLGTQAENLADMRAKGRGSSGHVYGEKCGKSKLKESEVREIIRLSKLGYRQRDIAARYGIHQSGVWGIVHRKTWTHVI